MLLKLHSGSWLVVGNEPELMKAAWERAGGSRNFGEDVDFTGNDGGQGEAVRKSNFSWKDRKDQSEGEGVSELCGIWFEADTKANVCISHFLTFTTAHVLIPEEERKCFRDDQGSRGKADERVNGSYNYRDYYMVLSSGLCLKLSSAAKVDYCWYGDDKEPAVDIAAMEIEISHWSSAQTSLALLAMTNELTALGIHPGVLSVSEGQVEKMLQKRVRLFVSEKFLPAKMIECRSIGSRVARKFICFQLDKPPNHSGIDLPEGCSGTMVYVKKSGSGELPYHRIGMFVGYLCDGIYWAVNLSDNIRCLEQRYPRLENNLFSLERSIINLPLINTFEKTGVTVEELVSDVPTQETGDGDSIDLFSGQSLVNRRVGDLGTVQTELVGITCEFLFSVKDQTSGSKDDYKVFAVLPTSNMLTRKQQVKLIKSPHQHTRMAEKLSGKAALKPDRLLLPMGNERVNLDKAKFFVCCETEGERGNKYLAGVVAIEVDLRFIADKGEELKNSLETINTGRRIFQIVPGVLNLTKQDVTRMGLKGVKLYIGRKMLAAYCVPVQRYLDLGAETLEPITVQFKLEDGSHGAEELSPGQIVFAVDTEDRLHAIAMFFEQSRLDREIGVSVVLSQNLKSLSEHYELLSGELYPVGRSEQSIYHTCSIDELQSKTPSDTP